MKKFYKSVAAVAGDEGYRILLDDRVIKTPLKADLILPSQALADAVAEEWRSQGDTVDPASMLMTQTANAAIDRVGARREAVIDELADFIGQDLLCYREPDDPRLIERQAKLWDPFIDWVNDKLGTRPVVTTGIMPVAQADALITALRDYARGLPMFRLAAFYQMATGLHSVMLGLAFMEGGFGFDTVWAAANLEHDYQIERWGSDADAEATLEARRVDVAASAAFAGLL